MKKMTALFLSFLMILCSCACAETDECEHLDFYTESKIENAEYVYVDEYLHHVTGEMTEFKVCIDCGERTGGEAYDLSEDEYHLYYDGLCESCGAVCDHPEVSTYDEHRNIRYKSKDAEYHTIIFDLYETTSCTICGYFIEDKLLEEGSSTDDFHYFIEGACTDCGEVNACPHENTKTNDAFEYLDCIPKDEFEHTLIGNRYADTYCLDCGEALSYELAEEGYETTEEHYFGDGFCYQCGAENTCAHENTETNDSFEYDSCLPKDEKEHTLIGALYAETYCYDCGEVVAYELVNENYEEDEEHWFSEGMCLQCGAENTCVHADTEVWEDYYTVETAPRDAFFHTLVSEQYNVYNCVDCGEEVSRELADDHYTSAGEHWFWEGECIECGYVDELDERVRLVGGVISSMEALRSFVGEANATVTLMNAEAVLTADELAAFEAITQTEKALVLMSAIGYEDAVREVLSYEVFVLTNEGETLLNAVCDRIAALTADEAAAREQVLDEFFPVERVTDDGVAMRTLTLLLSSPENGGAMTEVHTLLYSEDLKEWSFEMTEAG